MKPNNVIKKIKELGSNLDVEIRKIEQIDGAIVVSFMDNGATENRKLPKSWEEFCENFGTSKGTFGIDSGSKVLSGERPNGKLYPDRDKCLLPDRETAEAVLALCQLIQLRDYYNNGWKPDWTDDYEEKHVIINKSMTIEKSSNYIFNKVLCFKTKDLRNQFLKNFRNLIETVKPLI